MAAESNTQKSRTKESQVEAARHLLVAIKIDGQGTPTNFADWDRGVYKWVGAVDITWVADPNGSVSVPPDQQARVLAHSNALKAIQGGRVKTEEKEDSLQGKDSSSSSTSDTLSALLQAVAKRTAGKKAVDQKGTRADKTVYFLDTSLAFTKDEARGLESSGLVLAEVQLAGEGFEGQSWFCQVESKKQREDRFFVWREVEGTLGALDKSLWEHVPLGDVGALVKFIGDTFGRDRAAQQSKLWHLRLENFRIDEKKGFDIFLTEVRKLLEDAKVLDIKYDGSNVREKVGNAIAKGGSKTLLTEWVNAARVEARALGADSSLPQWSISEVLDEMRAGVIATQNCEKAMATVKAPAMATVGEGGSGSPPSALQREMEELKKQIKRFQSEKSDSGGIGGSKPVWLGVCGSFQDGACKRSSCAFNHTLLTDADKLELQEFLKKKAKAKAGGVTSTFSGKCFKCGKDGHRSNKCPSKGTASIKKTLVDLFKRDDFEQLLQQAKWEAKDQPEDEE
jgi:hypothetical protein